MFNHNSLLPSPRIKNSNGPKKINIMFQTLLSTQMFPGNLHERCLNAAICHKAVWFEHKPVDLKLVYSICSVVDYIAPGLLYGVWRPPAETWDLTFTQNHVFLSPSRTINPGMHLARLPLPPTLHRAVRISQQTPRQRPRTKAGLMLVQRRSFCPASCVYRDTSLWLTGFHSDAPPPT